jgi:hypothetical protein
VVLRRVAQGVRFVILSHGPTGERGSALSAALPRGGSHSPVGLFDTRASRVGNVPPLTSARRPPWDWSPCRDVRSIFQAGRARQAEKEGHPWITLVRTLTKITNL